VADFFKTVSDTVRDGDDQRVVQMVEKALKDRIEIRGRVSTFIKGDLTMEIEARQK
jgi:hypothetical protein